MHRDKIFQTEKITNSPHEHLGLMADKSGITGHDKTLQENLDREFENNEQFRVFVNSLKGNEVWLDLGSGRGSALIHFLKRKQKIRDANLISVDLDRRNLVDQQTNNHPGIAIQADAKQLPVRSKTVDFVVVAWMASDNQYVKLEVNSEISEEITRVLKAGGLVFYNDQYKLPREEYEFAFNIMPTSDGTKVIKQKGGLVAIKKVTPEPPF